MTFVFPLKLHLSLHHSTVKNVNITEGQVGWGFEQCGVMEGVPANAGGLELGDL